MKKKINLIIATILLCSLFSSSCEGDNLNKKEKAKTKFLAGTSKLYETGGIATFDVPSGQSAFRPPKHSELSPHQTEQMLKDSVNDLEEAIKLDPSLVEVYYFLGVAYLKLQDIQKAIEAFNNSVKIEPQRKSCYPFLSSLLIENKKYKEARIIANKFIEQFPDEKIDMLNLIALSYYKEGNYRTALKKGEEIVSIENKHIGAHLLLANSYYKLGNKEASEKEFKRIIEFDPNMAQKIEIIKSRLKEEEK